MEFGILLFNTFSNLSRFARSGCGARRRCRRRMYTATTGCPRLGLCARRFLLRGRRRAGIVALLRRRRSSCIITLLRRRRGAGVAAALLVGRRLRFVAGLSLFCRRNIARCVVVARLVDRRFSVACLDRFLASCFVLLQLRFFTMINSGGNFTPRLVNTVRIRHVNFLNIDVMHMIGVPPSVINNIRVRRPRIPPARPIAPVPR